jgi:CIC family chloride channel protein
LPRRIPKKIAEVWDTWLPRVLKFLRLEEHRVFIGLTIVIGLVAGLAAVLFHLAIEYAQQLFFGGLEDPSLLRLIMVPTLVSIVTGWLLYKYFPDARGSGVPQTKTAYLLHDGVINARTPFAKFLLGALTIGAGHSMGREGPSLQIGAGLASVLGRWFKLSKEHVKNLVPVGGAAAIGAAFNTPIAAVLFALEEIVGDLSGALLGSTVLASVSATVLARSILGNEPLFTVPSYQLAHPAELLAYAGLGVVGGFVSVAFSRGLLRVRKWFFTLPEWSVPWQPAMGGLAIGLLAALMTWQDAGGIFAPSLFIGAMVGGALGTVLQSGGLPFPTASPGAYALVGMGTLFAGIVRAPMTSIFMIFELTQDYEIVLPVMIANMIAYSISRRYQKIPLYHALLVQDRIHLPQPKDRVAVGKWRVRDVMTHEPKTLSIDATVSEALEQMKDWPGICFPVMKEDKLTGVITRSALEKLAAAEHLETEGEGGEKFDPATVTLGPLVMREDWEHVHPDNALEVALERLRESPGLLPVVSRLNTHKLEGVITLENVMKTFTYKKSI